MRKTILYFSFMLATLGAFAQTLPAIGTAAVVGKVDGIAIEAKVQSPSAQPTPLQVACLFEYTENDLTNPPALPAALNGMLHLDEALHGIITELRKSGRFTGHAYETLLITPPAGTIPAKKLLLIGLGDRNKFDASIMVTVGSIGMREALRLGVTAYSHASDLKDAGIDSPTALVAENVLKGALEAHRTQVFLKEKKMSDLKPLSKITLLAGPAFYAPSGEALKKVIASYHN
ncbi:M17 family peptidase N-terminal domain-containing protein [uncultured Chitinophaga sp.]|uniref:M17 family peptidase N-terminal domain-containing protein n=1 Tax=uncultured Chitinophaga sp. TaxID=339340 RepID=UPI0025F6E496|nr:M17 family peptidase N-terminal domain-containing protein [uncultured Chitinophaga sp.]